LNGIHDMGGMHGFGKVEVERDEPVFHTRWEARVFGMVQSLGRGNIDAGRHSLERLGPVEYLKDGYYGRWLATLLRGLLNAGVLTADEIESRMRSPRPSAPRAPSTKRWHPEPHSYARPVGSSPKFAVGQEVATRNHQPPGHTRLPAYARCRRGVVVLVHPAMVYPDDNAHGRGENPQYLYTVRFAARELWGDQAEPATCVHIDLFEPYLEPAGGRRSKAKRPTSKSRAAAPRP
jgi:nitrile hydratase